MSPIVRRVTCLGLAIAGWVCPQSATAQSSSGRAEGPPMTSGVAPAPQPEVQSDQGGPGTLFTPPEQLATPNMPNQYKPAHQHGHVAHPQVVYGPEMMMPGEVVGPGRIMPMCMVQSPRMIYNNIKCCLAEQYACPKYPDDHLRCLWDSIWCCDKKCPPQFGYGLYCYPGEYAPYGLNGPNGGRQAPYGKQGRSNQAPITPYPLPSDGGDAEVNASVSLNLQGSSRVIYPTNPYYTDPRDGRVYAAQGYGTPLAMPLAPNVEHTYNYSHGFPGSRLTPVSRMPNPNGSAN